METVQCVDDVRNIFHLRIAHLRNNTRTETVRLLIYLESNNATFEGGLTEVVNSSFKSSGSIVEGKNWVQY